ncbi:BrnA antitoxin family protein [Oscillatoria salina IIICB1]|nr:BrnA antitoxin family protein [Oscillatoria salina IIICB1]NET86906.1 BrnA antitoxin family protein [Kamptonema sp. SIO1D9]
MKDNYDFSKGKKGAMIPISEKQIKVNIPLDKEILDWFRTKVHAMGGGDYQALINQALHEYIQCQENQTVN